jgi:hypothetical protein
MVFAPQVQQDSAPAFEALGTSNQLSVFGSQLSGGI